MAGTALIGHTGFVGGTLLGAAAWDYCYNSTNIDEIAGQDLDLVICAGVSAVKWQANKAPKADQAGIDRLTGALGRARIRELVLISTIDVYPDPSAGGDEDTAIDAEQNHPYGQHRLRLERWAQERFEKVSVIRLPALFGVGLRKNVIYDLLNDNMLTAINPAGCFQWYPVERLWPDIAAVRAAGLDVVNLFPEPIPMSRIIDTCFPEAQVGAARHPAPRYDMQTKYAALTGHAGRYILSADEVMTSLAAFVFAKTCR